MADYKQWIHCPHCTGMYTLENPVCYNCHTEIQVVPFLINGRTYDVSRVIKYIECEQFDKAQFELIELSGMTLNPQKARWYVELLVKGIVQRQEEAKRQWEREHPQEVARQRKDKYKRTLETVLTILFMIAVIVVLFGFGAFLDDVFDIKYFSAGFTAYMFFYIFCLAYFTIAIAAIAIYIALLKLKSKKR